MSRGKHIKLQPTSVAIRVPPIVSCIWKSAMWANNIVLVNTAAGRRPR
jgi:hypothetical protein